MYFLRGSLPWQGLKAATKKQKYEKISEKKMATPTETLCKGFPTEFVVYFQYTRSLRFDDKPDYSYLRKLFRDLFVREGFVWDYVFDWTILKYQQQGGSSPTPTGQQASGVPGLAAGPSGSKNQVDQPKRSAGGDQYAAAGQSSNPAAADPKSDTLAAMRRLGLE